MRGVVNKSNSSDEWRWFVYSLERVHVYAIAIPSYAFVDFDVTRISTVPPIVVLVHAASYVHVVTCILSLSLEREKVR